MPRTFVSQRLVRRVWPRLFAEKLVSAQPLSQPSGLIFYLRHVYGKNMSCHQGIEFRAFQLWEEAGKPEGLSDHFWRKALEELTPEVQLVIQDELPPHLICRPAQGQGEFDYLVMVEPGSDPAMFAHAVLKENAFYIVWPTALALTDKREYGFDLNTENDLDELFVTLETLAARARRRVREQVRQKLESTPVADGDSIAVAVSGPPPQRRVTSSTKFTLPLISRFFNVRPNQPQQASDPK